MPTVLALLHGVKVGTARRVPMAAWRAQPASLGYGQVQTLLNSGNAVFRAPGRAGAPHARAIAAAIERGLGFRVPVQVKSAAQLTAIVAGNPLADSVADPARLLVAFAPDAPTLAALRGIAPLVAPPEALVVGEHAAYLHCAGGILERTAALPAASTLRHHVPYRLNRARWAARRSAARIDRRPRWARRRLPGRLLLRRRSPLPPQLAA